MGIADGEAWEKQYGQWDKLNLPVVIPRLERGKIKNTEKCNFICKIIHKAVFLQKAIKTYYNERANFKITRRKRDC